MTLSILLKSNWEKYAFSRSSCRYGSPTGIEGEVDVEGTVDAEIVNSRFNAVHVSVESD